MEPAMDKRDKPKSGNGVKSLDDLPSPGQPRDDESLGDHSLAHTDRDRPKGTGDRNKGMLHHG
jgi:hypothetical protein